MILKFGLLGCRNMNFVVLPKHAVFCFVNDWTGLKLTCYYVIFNISMVSPLTNSSDPLLYDILFLLELSWQQYKDYEHKQVHFWFLFFVMKKMVTKLDLSLLIISSYYYCLLTQLIRCKNENLFYFKIIAQFKNKLDHSS